jgi:hypothetical protein
LFSAAEIFIAADKIGRIHERQKVSFFKEIKEF